MSKIRAAIVGYGNIGKSVLEALIATSDFEIAGIVRRTASLNEDIPELAGFKVVDNIKKLENVDVAILSSPTRKVLEQAKEILALNIHTVDSYDIHNTIWNVRQELEPIAKTHQAVSIISAGWDPGSDSMIRALLLVMAPKGITYTNFGPGMSMGHTVAVKAIDGVKKALSMTIPMGTGVHRRMVYVEIEDDHTYAQVANAIKEDDYFKKDETHVIEVESVDNLLDKGHGVHLVRKGVSGSTDNQLFEFNMKINNPALTAQIMVACARAATRMTPGAYTMIEIPLINLLQGDKEALIRALV
ncbi:MAG: diaminopimelate dehydrogenase [Chitinophagales bacterium]|nr:diaminopimelate dehydrogenase [Chitinophagales bacterium]